MEIRNGIAHIPVGGAIGKNLTPFDRGSGAVDVNDLAAELQQAEEDPAVRGILMHFDSPGGMVSGTPELARTVERVQKPIYSFTDGLLASAAYWIAAATDGIFATATANVGSIGVYVPFHDLTKRAEMQGIKVELIKTGKYKGMGYPGTALTEDQRAHLQERVEEHVRRHRSGVKADSMQGQTFLGAQALSRGLIDGLVENSEQTLQLVGLR